METKIPKEGCIDDMIFTIRGQRVMLDRNLAELYEVPTYRLNEAVKRHITRFPKRMSDIWVSSVMPRMYLP